DLLVGHFADYAAGLLNRETSLLVADRVSNPDGAGDCLGADLIPVLKALPEALVEGVRPFGLDSGEPGKLLDPASLIGLKERLSEGAGVTQISCGERDPVRRFPGKVLQGLPDDGLLP